MAHTAELSMAAVWLVALLAAAPCTAQDDVAPLPGTRLRVTAPTAAAGPIVGTLVGITEREITLAVSASDRTVVPVASVNRVEWSKGRHGNTVKGLLFGAAIGALLFTVAGCSGETCTSGNYIGFAGLGACLGALPGAGVGALVKTERWAELPLANLRVTPAPLPGHGVGLRFTFTW